MVIGEAYNKQVNMEKQEYQITVILPVYNEAKALEANFIAIAEQLKSDRLIARYIIVDDGSTDDTWKVVGQIAASNENVKGISFAKNFGKEIALAAGIDYAEGEYVAIMDSDLQHPPHELRAMLEQLIADDADMVLGRKSDRGRESFWYRFFAKSFYRTLEKISKLEMQNSSDFMIMRQQVVKEVQKFSERNLFFRGIIDWVGFKKSIYYFQVGERSDHSDSRFSLHQLARLALNAVVAYSSKPLYSIVVAGAIFAVFAALLTVNTIWNYLSGNAVDGFSTVILLLLIGFSLVVFSLGIIGVYLSRIYDEIKARPRYIVQAETEDEDGKK